MRAFTNLLMVLAIVAGVVTLIFTFISLGLMHPAPWIILAIIIIIPILHSKYVSSGYVRWKDSYSVDIPSIDDDHKRLINLINQLQSAIHYYQSKEFEEKALKELIDYTKFHFDREEKLMQEHNYPGYEEHVKQHGSMVNKVNDIVANYSQDSEETICETVKFLRDWLINHIQKTDQQYVEFFKDKGVA